jgi:AcrR family transcriptional regulator
VTSTQKLARARPRPHNSPLRREQAAATRARIVDAAALVFAENGYERARIEDIAKRAGVAYPTVYKVFGNKPALLTAAVNTTITGTGEEEVQRQAWFVEQLDEPDPERQLRLIARNARRIYERAGSLLEVVRAAAASDETINALWKEINADRLKRSQATARRLARKTKLRTGPTETARTLSSLTIPELYVHLVDHGDLTPEVYERWLADLLVAALLP